MIFITILTLLWCVFALSQERLSLSQNLFMTCDNENQVRFSSMEGLRERTFFSFDTREVLSVKAFEKFDIVAVQGSYRLTSSKPL